jgi:hypothetical protein
VKITSWVSGTWTEYALAREPAIGWFAVTSMRVKPFCRATLALALGVHGLFKGGLVHFRPSSDSASLRLGVELLERAPPRPVCPGAQPTATAGRYVVCRCPRARAGFACTGSLLVHGAGRDLLGELLGAPLIELAFLDVLVLTGPLRSFFDSSWWDDLSNLAVMPPISPLPHRQNTGRPASGFDTLSRGSSAGRSEAAGV